MTVEHRVRPLASAWLGEGQLAQSASPRPGLSFTYSVGAPGRVLTDLLVLPVYRGSTAPEMPDLDAAGAYEKAKLSGEVAEDLLLPRREGDSFTAAAVLLVGMGPRAGVTADVLRATARRVGYLYRRFSSIATTLPQSLDGEAGTAVRATIEGFSAGAYRFRPYATTTDVDPASHLTTVQLLGRPDWAEVDLASVMQQADVTEHAVAWARDLVNLPAADLTPDRLADQAREMAAELPLTVRIWDEDEMQEGGFGGILGVGSGSRHESRLIELRYEPASGNAQQVIALTGKGITFDSGGLFLKKSEDMLEMKSDTAGAATVLAAMRVIGSLAPDDVAVIAAIPAAENMPGCDAVRPGDVLRHRNGLTTEVVDPDCEGRLVLADSLALLTESAPASIIDVATLTYACITALGTQITAGIGNSRELMNQVATAGQEVGEPVWELPLWHPYTSQLDSTVADQRNEGKDDSAGAIVAALFLERFVGEIAWVHLDIGGTAFTEEDADNLAAGGTGVMVRTLVRLILQRNVARHRKDVDETGDIGRRDH
jgi:leucyl aminopeptidase